MVARTHRWLKRDEKSLHYSANLSLNSLIALASEKEDGRNEVLERATDTRLTEKQVKELIEKVRTENNSKLKKLDKPPCRTEVGAQASKAGAAQFAYHREVSPPPNERAAK
jgi:hypothetical protein